MRFRVIAVAAACVLAASDFVNAQTAQSTPVYQANFDSANGTPAITPGGGVLGITNGTGYTGGSSFTSTGGIMNTGAYDNSASTYNNATKSGYASTTSTGGSSISGLPNQGVNTGDLSAFTITLWVKTANNAVDGTGENSGGTYQGGRLFVLGASGDTDDFAANAFGLNFRGGKLDLVANNFNQGAAQSKGNLLAGGVWNFIAISYDAAGNPFNDPNQNVALGVSQTGGNSDNAQLYEGTDSVTVNRSPIASTNGSNTASTGTISVGNAASLFLLNNATLTRGVAGVVDDFRIYSSILTPAQVESVRLEDAPEPASLCFMGLFGGWVFKRRHSRMRAS